MTAPDVPDLPARRTLQRAFRLPVTLVARLTALADREGINLSDALRRALARGLAAIERDSQPVQVQAASAASGSKSTSGTR